MLSVNVLQILFYITLPNDCSNIYSYIYSSDAVEGQFAITFI